MFIGRFIRALNVALNADMAKQRLRASQTVLNRFRDPHSRQGPLSNAISRVENARDQIGANVTFTLGSGNLFTRLRNPSL